jgi:hypothetical protein
MMKLNTHQNFCIKYDQVQGALRNIWVFLCTYTFPVKICTIGAGIVLLGIALHLLALSYNRAAIVERQKFREMSDLQYIRNRIQGPIL